MSPADIQKDIKEVMSDGQITPDETDKVLKIFDAATARIEKLNADKEAQRAEFEKKHDAQIVQMAIVIASSIGLSVFGILAGLGFDAGQIGTIMLTLCGSLITGIGMAFVKRYIPALVEPIKKAAAVVRDAVPEPMKSVLDNVAKTENPSPEPSQPDLQPETPNPPQVPEVRDNESN